MTSRTVLSSPPRAAILLAAHRVERPVGLQGERCSAFPEKCLRFWQKAAGLSAAAAAGVLADAFHLLAQEEDFLCKALHSVENSLYLSANGILRLCFGDYYAFFSFSCPWRRWLRGKTGIPFP